MMQQSGITATHITVKMLNLPKGVNLRWPNAVMFDDPVSGPLLMMDTSLIHGVLSP